jgi:hypothetical protein
MSTPPHDPTPPHEPSPPHEPTAPPEEDLSAQSEEALRAAWEEQMRHITAADVIVQTAVSLVNLAGRRLGLAPGSEDERDLGQVRDAIDGVRALLPVLERGEPPEALAPLRDAVSALQVEYAKLVGPPAGAAAAPKAPAGGGTPSASDATEPSSPGGPGPAQSSGRLWIPGQ